MAIKAIETHYDGYRFRSRLEARWAVFFNQANIPYEYEIEGVVVDGKAYLPDFYLPWFDCFVEVKPTEIDSEYLELLKKLSKEKSVILVKGDPLTNDMTLYEGGKGYKCSFVEGCLWGEENAPFGFTKHWITILCESNNPVFKTPNTFGMVNYNGETDTLGCLYKYRTDFEIHRRIAREARFEHGETP